MYLTAFVDGVLATVVIEIIVVMGLAIYAAMKEGKSR